MSREEIIAANPIVDFVRNRGHELKRAGKNFVTNASPVAQHKRGHRPVMIYPENNSWFDHDLKLGGSVIDWVMHERGCDAAQAMRELSGNNGAAEIVATYDYTDEGGNLLFQCVRFQPKDFRQRQPAGKGGWIWNLDGAQRVLYRLPEVLKAQTVCVAEGEKDCNNLAKLGFVATTNPLGAGKWRDEYSETLRGKDMIVFGDVDDNDGKGEKHTQDVIESLTGKAKSIKNVKLPDGFHDVSDYIASLPPDKARDEIRKLIDETPEIDDHSLGIQEPVGESPALAPYTPPPLDLLPEVLREYVLAAAEALNVDRGFILLPVLSSLGAAIGNARSILLKSGFIQPPVIWTGIIGRSGTRKSPALEAGCLPVMKYERKLNRENDTAAEIAEEFQKEKSKKREKKTAISTCVCDDLTIEVLADRLVANPHGLLVRKDELSHWLASFDQYKNTKGSDVSRWLSLHTGVFVAVDRKKDDLHHRIWQPRVCITGGIQPKVFRRVLTPDYFERGLPARFLLGYPPFRQDRWSEATIPDELRKGVLELFGKLWSLQPEEPEHHDHGQSRPKLLRMDADAKAVFVDFYNACGTASIEAGEHEEAAWNKLTGYGARLALVGQLARDPEFEFVTGKTMQAACDLARWFGNEAVRIYAELAETPEQTDQRELIEFIERRGGAVYEREVMQSFTRLKNDKAGTERELTALVKEGRGKWEPVEHSGGPGRPTRKFRLLRSSTSTQFAISRGKTQNSVDVDTPNSQKITPPEKPETKPTKPASVEVVAMPSGVLEL
jgi:5S rRNA maturation endonuclease (ribonuclease M5)